MMDFTKIEQALAELPLYFYGYIDPQSIEFSERIRHICSAECPMHNQTWACPPAVGEVSRCKAKCHSYGHCLLIGTITEVNDIANMEETLNTRPAHEEVTNAVRDLFREQGVDPYILSTEACNICDRCAWLDGAPCRYPDRMHPCVESHGINLIPTLEENGLEFQYGDNIVTWYSLLFF